MNIIIFLDKFAFITSLESKFLFDFILYLLGKYIGIYCLHDTIKERLQKMTVSAFLCGFPMVASLKNSLNTAMPFILLV